MTGVRIALQQLDIKSEVEIVSYVRLMQKAKMSEGYTRKGRKLTYSENGVPGYLLKRTTYRISCHHLFCIKKAPFGVTQYPFV